MTNEYQKAHKTKHGEQIYFVRREGRAGSYIGLIDLERELARAQARVIEIEEDLKEVKKLDGK